MLQLRLLAVRNRHRIQSVRYFGEIRNSSLVDVIHCQLKTFRALQWRHHGPGDVSNHQPLHCLLNRLFSLRSKKTLKLRVTGLHEGNSPVNGEFPAQLPVTRKMFHLMTSSWWPIVLTNIITNATLHSYNIILSAVLDDLIFGLHDIHTPLRK